MKTLIATQELLLKWFKVQHNRSFTTTKISYLCNELNVELELNLPSKQAYYKILMPLVRLGLVDFCNENRLRLAPSVLLQNGTSIVGVNIPNPFYKKLKEQAIDFEVGIFGVIRFPNHVSSKLKTLGEKHQYPFQKTDTIKYLKCLPSFEKIVASLELTDLVATNDFDYFSKNRSWKKEENKCGIYRSSEESYTKRYFSDGKKWWLIDRDRNPDIFNLMACYACVRNDWELDIIYTKKDKKLTINHIYFPILLDRLISRYLLPTGELIKMRIEENTYHAVPEKLFLAINRIFQQKITKK